jgi:hypothetical protein
MQNFITLGQHLLREKYAAQKEKRKEKAGAELCQAQVKLGLAMLDLLSTKLRSSSLC